MLMITIMIGLKAVHDFVRPPREPLIERYIETEEANRLAAATKIARLFASYARRRPEMIRALADAEPWTRVVLAEALIGLLDHKSPAVRDAALGVLASYTQQATFQKLIDELRLLTASIGILREQRQSP